MSIIERIVVRILNAIRPTPRAKAKGLLLGHALEAGKLPVYMSTERRFEHTVIVGKTGVGKTHCLEQLAAQHFQRGEGFCFVDYHGDATNHLLKLASAFPDAQSRLILIDPTNPERSPGYQKTFRVHSYLPEPTSFFG